MSGLGVVFVLLFAVMIYFAVRRQSKVAHFTVRVE